MPRERLLDSVTINDGGLNNLPRGEKPTIKILLYTDAPDVVVPGPVGDFGLGRMLGHLEGHAPAFANVRHRRVSRYPSSGTIVARNKLDFVLQEEFERTGQPFDQIWFFGIHQVNKRNADLGLGGGTPESELTADEVGALRAWMDQGGGVLITGDHANQRPADALPPDPNSPCADNSGQQRLLGLGRALGKCVPRAGQLRRWEGEPTANRDNSFNTQALILGISTDDIALQGDTFPQELSLRTFDENGSPAPDGQPHPLFFFREGRAIRFFPDHAHEGAVVIPEVLDESMWPRNADGFQPQPRLVACGLDKRNGTKLNLVAAYDGSAAGVGRIVADSTWHHYFNVNLENFRHTVLENEATDQIGQFYANLAVWLSPAEKRRQMADAMVRWLAQQPSVLEEYGPEPTEHLGGLMSTGAVARMLLARMASPCEIHELLQMTFSAERRRQFETLYLPEKGLALSRLPSKQLVLGYLVNRYPREATKVSRLSLANEERLTAVGDAFIGASEQAFRRQRREVTRTMNSVEKFSPAVRLNVSQPSASKGLRSSSDAASSIQPVERSNAMAACSGREWQINLTLDNMNPSPSERILFREVVFTAGVITGEVHDEPGELMSALRGTCTPSVVAGQPDMSHMSLVFTVKDNRGRLSLLHLIGIAYQPPGSPPPLQEFRGTFRAYSLPIGGPFSFTGDPALLTGQLEELTIDPGDTGTGNGQQT